MALTVAIGLSEILLRLFLPIPYHEWMVWEGEKHIRARPVPNQTIHTATGSVVRINRHGFRGPDYDFKRAPGTLRIAVFGGSAGFNFHAAGREKTWPGALERKLRTRLDLPVEVINLALPGFNSFISKINYLTFGRAFDPHAIIVYHTWNDMKSFRARATVPYKANNLVPSKPLWQKIARATQLGRRGRQFFMTMRQTKMENKYSSDAGTGKRKDRPVASKAFDWERKNFEDFAKLAKSDGGTPNPR